MPIVNLKNKVTLSYSIFENKDSDRRLVMIPGLSGDTISFGNIVTRFKRFCTVVVVDPRGVGRTVIPAGEKASVENMAEDIALLVDHLGYRKADFLGHSMGGYIAQELAVEYSERVNSIILSCTSAGMNEISKKALSEICEQRVEGKLSDREFNEKFLRNFTSPIICDDDFILQTMLDFIDQNPYAQTIEGFVAQVSACKEFNFSKKIADIDTPTLIIAGELDKVATLEDAFYLKNNIKNSKLKMISGVYHMPYMENSTEYAENVINFLKNR